MTKKLPDADRALEPDKQELRDISSVEEHGQSILNDDAFVNEVGRGSDLTSATSCRTVIKVGYVPGRPTGSTEQRRMQGAYPTFASASQTYTATGRVVPAWQMYVSFEYSEEMTARNEKPADSPSPHPTDASAVPEPDASSCRIIRPHE